jgi:hypothetical protein
MNEREKIHEWIDRYTEGTLRGEELEQFLALVEKDPELRREIRADALINESLEDRDLLEFRKAMRRSAGRGGLTRRLPGWILLAASALLILGTGGLFIFLRMGNLHPGGLSRKMKTVVDSTVVDSTSQAGVKPVSGNVKKQGESVPGQTMLAENFRPLPSLESLVGEPMRSSGFKLSTPAFDLKIHPGDTVKYAWSSGGRVTIDLVNNKGRRIHTWDPGEQTKFDLLSAGLSPGLYYWKILDRTGLVCLGRIRVE